MNLYELTKDFLEVRSHLEEMDLDPETLKDTLDSVSAPLEEKVENILKYMKNLEAEEKAYKEESDRLKTKAASVAKKQDWLKTYLDDNLKAAGIKELKAGVFQVKYRKGSEVVQVDESTLPLFVDRPDLYIQIEPKPLGKADLKKRIQSGEEIPGVTLVRNPDSLVVK